MSWRLRPGPFGQVIGDAPEQMLLLLDRARVGDGNLNEDQVVGIGDAEITRGVHDVSLRCALGDDLEEIVLRHLERLDQGRVNTLRYSGVLPFGIVMRASGILRSPRQSCCLHVQISAGARANKRQCLARPMRKSQPPASGTLLTERLRAPDAASLVFPTGHLTRLPANQRALAGEAPVVASKGPVAAQHAMTWHHERDRVAAHRRADRA
jgi:hypothetical protein